MLSLYTPTVSTIYVYTAICWSSYVLTTAIYICNYIPIYTAGESWTGPEPIDQYQEALRTTAYHEYTATHTPAQPPNHLNNIAEADTTAAAELQLLEHSSLYFIRNKFPPIFLEFERKNIFEIVLPEMYMTDVAASLKDTENYLTSTTTKLNNLEKQLYIQTNLIQSLLSKYK